MIRYRVHAGAQVLMTTRRPVGWYAKASIERRDNQDLDLDWDADINAETFAYRGSGVTKQQAISDAVDRLRAHMSEPDMYGGDTTCELVVPVTTSISAIIDDRMDDPDIRASVTSAIAYAKKMNDADAADAPTLDERQSSV